jgi:hypothetical protein
MDIVSALRNSVGALSGKKYSSGERIICHMGQWRDGETSLAEVLRGRRGAVAAQLFRHP